MLSVSTIIPTSQWAIPPWQHVNSHPLSLSLPVPCIHIPTAPEVLEILEDDLMNGQKACSRVNLCPPPAPGPITPNRILTPSNLSDLTGEKPWPSWDKNGGIGYFIQITDQHIVSTAVGCKEPGV